MTGRVKQRRWVEDMRRRETERGDHDGDDDDEDSVEREKKACVL